MNTLSVKKGHWHVRVYRQFPLLSWTHGISTINRGTAKWFKSAVVSYVNDG